MSELIVNKVAKSGLITLDLAKYLPKEQIQELDIKPFLFKEMILKEKDFRESMKEHDWTQYQDKNLAVFCSNDAIIPHWAFMLISVYATPYVNFIAVGNKAQIQKMLLRKNLESINLADYTDERVIIKGCGNPAVGADAYAEISRRLQKVVKSLMYGEACSTVPIYKKK